MTASNNGPVLAGSFSENNKTSFSFSSSQKGHAADLAAITSRISAEA